MKTWMRFNLWRLSFWFATHHELNNLGFIYERTYYATRSLNYNGKRVSWELCWLRSKDWQFTSKHPH